MKKKTVRLLMPQWQGGNWGVSYPLGARILAFLAPESDAPLLEVPVEPYNGTALRMEDGLYGREVLVKQMRAARHLLDAYQPDRVITFGGDCLVSQAPFAYLNVRYEGKLGVLWIDAHPDVTTPKQFTNAHAMVLGNLLGEGDPGLAKEVQRKINPDLVMFAGVNELDTHEVDVINRLGLACANADELKDNSNAVLQWLRDKSIQHLAIHLDLDVIDAQQFRSLMFNNPQAKEKIAAPHGKMSLQQVTRVITDVAATTDVVGMTFAEHMPWDDINLKNMMEQFDFMR